MHVSCLLFVFSYSAIHKNKNESYEIETKNSEHVVMTKLIMYRRVINPKS